MAAGKWISRTPKEWRVSICFATMSNRKCNHHQQHIARSNDNLCSADCREARRIRGSDRRNWLRTFQYLSDADRMAMLYVGRIRVGLHFVYYSDGRM